MKKIDIKGQQFGHWTAIEFHSTYKSGKGGYSVWTCVCSCGNTSNVSLSALKTGISTSCGCQKALKLKARNKDFETGSVINGVEILERVEDTRSKSGRINKRFKVKCKCGVDFISHKQTIVKTQNLCCIECGRLKAAKKQNTSKTLFHWKTNEEINCVGSYELKVVSWLNANKMEFSWKPKTFSLPSGRKYTPDLYINSMNSFIEIKGWWWNSKSYFDEFKQFSSERIELWDRIKLKTMGLIK